MTEEIIQRIKKSFDLAKETNNLNSNHLDEAVKLTNSLITESIYKNTKTINTNDVEFTDNFFKDKYIVTREVTDKVDVDQSIISQIDLTIRQSSKLSKILFDIYYPKPVDNLFYHYTKISALRHILKGNLKLNSLIKNENYHEFKTFYEDHNILGYFENVDNDGSLMKESLMKEIYAFCMASKNNLSIENESSLWNSFGDNKRGVRIEFEIETQHPDFRNIFYRERDFIKENLLINKLNNEYINTYNRILYITGVSKIGAFYLPGYYKIENEVRFAIKKHTDDYEFNFKEENGYIILPFESEYATFKIKKIKIGEDCSDSQIQEIKSILEENGYSTSIIE